MVALGLFIAVILVIQLLAAFPWLWLLLLVIPLWCGYQYLEEQAGEDRADIEAKLKAERDAKTTVEYDKRMTEGKLTKLNRAYEQANQAIQDIINAE